MRARLGKLLWVARLAVGKLREGPGPWLRAVRRGLFDLLPASLKASLARRRYRLPASSPHAVTLDGAGTERPGEVSVILPVFNQADMLAESIDSVLAQTHRQFELIILNDGSTDAVDAVLQRYAGEPRVRILTQPNRRLPAALSNAFRFAQGQYRTWTSADNLMEPEQLVELIGFLEAHPTTAMVYADYRVIGPDGAPLHGSDFRPQNRATPESCEVRLPRDTSTLNVLQDNFIGACFLYRGWVGRLVGGYSSKLGIEDYDYWMRIHAGFGIEHLGSDALLYRYRWHDNSLNARAQELRLFEVGEQLLQHERQRALWRAEPWRIEVHDSQAWAGGLSHAAAQVVALDPAAPAVAGKRMLLIAAAAVSAEAIDELTADLVAMEWHDQALVYRFADRLRDPRLLHFAEDPGVLAALGLFCANAYGLAPGLQRLELAMAYGDEQVCARRAEPAPMPPLPKVWTAPGRRRRVLLQVDDFVQGGLECVVLDAVRTLRSRGFDFELLVLGEQGAMVAAALAMELPVVSLAARTEIAYAGFLQAHRVELVWAHHSLFGAEVAAQQGIPFVQTLHNTYHWFYPDEIEAWRRNDAATTAYLHVSANVALFAHQKLGLDPSKSLVLNNGVAAPVDADGSLLQRVEDLRRSYGLAADDYVFLNVASVYPPKSQLLIARALGEARQRDARLKVILLGRPMNDGYVQQLQTLSAELGLGDCLIQAGYHEDTEAFYQLADAFLLPSYWEGCSLAVAEALRRDLPCVLTAVGAAQQQLAAGEGWLVDPPFGAIAELDFGSLKEVLAQPRPGFVGELTTAMLACAQRGKLAPDQDRQDRFELCAVAERWAQVLAWVQDGGAPAAARPFCWAGWRDGELC